MTSEMEPNNVKWNKIIILLFGYFVMELNKVIISLFEKCTEW